MIVRLVERGKPGFRGRHSLESRRLMSMKARFRRWALIYWPEALRDSR